MLKTIKRRSSCNDSICSHKCRRIRPKRGTTAMVLSVYLKLPGRFIMLLANKAGFSMAVMNNILFAHTWPVLVIATVCNHTNLVQGTSWWRRRFFHNEAFHYTSVWLSIFHIIHCCPGFTCSTEHPFVVWLYFSIPINPLSPHDALKHHFTSPKTDVIFLQPMVLEGKFPWK